MDKLVFIQDANCQTHSAHGLESIFNELLSKGKGSFIRGFEKMYSEAEKIEDRQANRYPESETIEVKRYTMPDISFLMEYNGVDLRSYRPNTFPRIYEISYSDKYKKGLERIK